MTRILGLDPGERRVGVAISDPTATIAFPLVVLDAAPRDALAAELRRICEQKTVRRIVVGLPVRTCGAEGDAAARARAFAQWVAEATGQPVELWDERFTTRTAEQALVEAGLRQRERRGAVDKLAAQILLQHYLDSKAGRRAGSPLDDEGSPP
ncbi:MAG: Holliday junction resolvase RuvX [Kiritimatiellae bacterium]|nr:Holliday junction resolvase RuvX [Kiritimatiellia bacterium]